MKIDDLSNNTGMAKILSDACSQDIPEVYVYFLNCYESNMVNIKMFGAIPQGKGFGSKAMQLICKTADQEGIDLVLKPSRADEYEKLIKFYEKFGFRMHNPVEMIRVHRNK